MTSWKGLAVRPASGRCARRAVDAVSLAQWRETYRPPYKNAPTRALTAGGVTFAYRGLGPRSGRPVVFITHLAAVLDNWDPRGVDGIAAKRRVITFDNRGVGASSGSTPKSIQEMAKDAVTFIRALGLEHVDIHGFSMGGMIAQVIAETVPDLVRRLILTGTGPAGGEGIKNVTRLSHLDTVRALLTLQDPKQFLFFTRTANGRRAGKEFLASLKERTQDRDKAISLAAYGAQLKVIHRWGLERPQDLSVIHQPVLVANGDDDRMVPTPNSVDLARRVPNGELVIYPDAGHGGIFQFHRQFVETALEFLERQGIGLRTVLPFG
ncbi:alpha/beta fold hydrolase [Streptomyces sp. SAS_270]|uniref:alpha/beta fold hydrolase n=1 Tax=Streptomyces sp. SAS_270 TaxID=3412748 RepID=UPI00403C944B